MKIAFITPEFPHSKTGVSGGIGTSIRNLATGLVQAGHEPVVLVCGQDRDEVFEDEGIAFYRIKNVRFKGLSWYFTRKKIEKLINRLHRERKVDVAEAPDWLGLSSFIQPKGCPIVVRLNGSDTYFCHLDKRKVGWASRFHEKRALEKADALLSVSRYTADVTAELFGLDREFTIIPNSIDAAKFIPSATPVKPNTILYFGTLIRKKGLLELPYIFNETVRQNPAARLVLVGRDSGDIVTGSASTWKLMQPLFSKEALANVDYVGGVAYEDIRKHINEAAVCVFPTFAEALPVSWIEAMAIEKASVASDIGWAKEVIDDGKNGFLVDPKNHTLFAQKIAMLLDDSLLRETIGSEARKKVLSAFDSKVVTEQNIRFYEKILQK